MSKNPVNDPLTIFMERALSLLGISKCTNHYTTLIHNTRGHQVKPDIKRDACIVGLHTVVRGLCVLLLMAVGDKQVIKQGTHIFMSGDVSILPATFTFQSICLS